MAREGFFSRLAKGIQNLLGISRPEQNIPPESRVAPPPPTTEPAVPPMPAEPEPSPIPILPPSMFGGGGDNMRDDNYIDHDDERTQLINDVAGDFVDEYGYPEDGIEVSFDADFIIGDYDLGTRSPSAIFYGDDAAAFLDNPSYSAVFDSYVTGSGFSLQQWINGMGSVSNFTIKPL